MSIRAEPTVSHPDVAGRQRRVKLTRDLSQCRIYWSSLGDGGARTTVARGLEDAREALAEVRPQEVRLLD